MRLAPSRSEEQLWRRLAGSKTGFASRGQLVIGRFIVDFAPADGQLPGALRFPRSHALADTPEGRRAEPPS